MALRHVRVRTAAVLTIVLAAAGVVAATPAANASDRPVSTTQVTVPMIFPVIGGASFTDTFGAARSHGGHEGQDLMAPKMRKLVAVFDGTIGQISTRSGNYVALNGTNGWTAIYIHMNNDTPGTDDGAGTASWFILPGIKVGAKLYAGQQIGWTGDSGNAESTAPHTHFELVKGSSAWSGTVYNPYLSLKAAKVLSRPYLSGPHQAGALVAATGRGYWLLAGGKRWRVYALSFAAFGWTSANVMTITGAELSTYPVGGWLPLPDGLVTRDSEGKIWVVARGGRIAVPAGTDLARLGTTAARVVNLETVIVTKTPLAADQRLPGVVRPGALLLDQGDQSTWYIDGTVRRRVPNTSTATSWGWDLTTERTAVAAGSLAGVPVGANVRLRDGTVFTAPDGKWYLVTGATKRPLPTAAVREAYGYDRVPRIGATEYSTGLLPLGTPLP
jgi:hypothetical protein